MSAHQFLVDANLLDSSTITLAGPELKHFRVRRIGIGEQVLLTDGQGTRRYGTVARIGKREALIELELSQQQDHSAQQPDIALAIALVRDSKLDYVVEHATELGASRIILMTTERSRATISLARVERLRRIARSATKQCLRSTIPTIEGPIDIRTVVSNPRLGLRLLFWESAPASSALWNCDQEPELSSALAVIGPEGGFSTAEVEMASAAGFQSVRLARNILRSETAALAAVAILQARFAKAEDHLNLNR